MRKNTLFKLIFIALFSLLGGLFITSKASASGNWCAVLAPGTTYNSCLGSQDYTTCTVIDRTSGSYGGCGNGQTSAQLKNDFITNLTWYQNNGQSFEKTDAVWIEDQLGGSDWASRINEAQVTMKVESYTYSYNTAFDPSYPSDGIQAQGCSVNGIVNVYSSGIVQYCDNSTQLSVVIFVNGVPYFAIKLDCGNPVGELHPLPKPTATISGHVGYFNRSTNTTVGLAGVKVYTCNSNPPTTSGIDTGNAQVTYNPGGSFSFTLSVGTSFCVRTNQSSAYQYVAPDGTIYSNPIITPAYVKPQNPPPKIIGHCGTNNVTYEAQIANNPNSPGQCNYELPQNYGYNIEFQKMTTPTFNNVPALQTCPVSGVPTTIAPSAGSTITLPAAAGSTICLQAGMDNTDNNIGSQNIWMELIPDPAAHSNTYTNGICPLTQNKQYDPKLITCEYNNGQTADGSGKVYHYAWERSQTPNAKILYLGENFTISNNYAGQLCFHSDVAPQTNQSAYLDTGRICFQVSSSFKFPTQAAPGITFKGGLPDSPSQVSITPTVSVDMYGGQPVYLNLNSHPINYNGNYFIIYTNGSTKQLSNPGPVTLQGKLKGSTCSPPQVYYCASVTLAPIQIPVSGLNAGDEVCSNFTVTPSAGTMNGATGQIISIKPNSGPANSATSCQVVGNEPYVRFYGNDVVSGMNFQSGDSCSSANAGIIGDYNGFNALAIGSGDQFAAMSLGDIQNFATAFLRTSTSPPVSYNGLALANSGTGSPGNFGSSCVSIENYALNEPTPLKVYNLTQLTNNFYGITDTDPSYVEIDSSDTTPVSIGNPNLTGQHYLYIIGNVYISNNITFSNTATTYSASKAKILNIPSLYVIATGNIYIAPSVTQLDGVYVAEDCKDNPSRCSSTDLSNNAGGIINTCADVSSAGPSSDAAFSSITIFSNCYNQLEVQGSLIAHTIKFDRTFDSIRDSKPGENPISNQPAYTCTGENGSPQTSLLGCASEVFNFDPIDLLSSPDQNQINSQPDSIISLPPVL